MSEISGEADSPSVPAGTAPALEGYFYQLDVSILVALELVMARQVTRSVVLEPVESKEDLELDIDDEPQLLAERADLGAYRLVIQCKLRNTGPWKVGELARLLTHGKRRPSAAARLAEDPAVRYLLITNADLDGVARAVRITELGVWPHSTGLPRDLATLLPGTAPGRVAVLPVWDNEKVTGRIEEVLTNRFRVPRAHLEICRKDLREEAFLRMRGAANGAWTRDDLDRLIRKHGGFSGRAEALEGFVPPTNWAQLRQLLATQHAIVLTGPSGTGKTRVAQALIASLRDDIPGIAVSEVDGAPEKINQEKRRPVVFYIEDPWGRYQPDPDAIAWNDSINALLRSASPDRLFVITSRSDVFLDSGPKDVRPRFMGRLESQNYGRNERARLLRHRMALRLPPSLQMQMLPHVSDALAALTTPLEIERYVDALSDGLQPGEYAHQYFDRCLREAHQGSIEHSILLNVRQRNAHRWAALVWGLFKAHSPQTFVTLPLIQSGLSQKDLAFEDGLSPYVNFLIAGHNLRQAESDLTYYHPRVELGLQQAVQERPGQSARVLQSLAETLVGLGKSGELAWGLEGAVRLLSASQLVQGVAVKIGRLEQAELDQWLRLRLSSPGAQFQDDLRLAERVGSPHCAPAELARWLLHRPEREVVVFDVSWQAPSVTTQWIATIRADAATHTICSAFVRRVLAHDHGFYREDFAHEVLNLAPNLAPAFRDAALDSVRNGYTVNADAIVTGALEDLDAFEPILARCVEFREQLRARIFDDEWLAIIDGHYDEEATEHFEQSAGEEGYTAGEFTSAYVIKRRSQTGWRALRDHAHRTGLLYDWIRAVSGDPETTDEEWSALADSVSSTEWESGFWEVAMQHWSPLLAGIAQRRVLEGGGDDATRITRAEVFARHMSPQAANIAAELVRTGPRRVLELACDLGSAARESQDSALLTSAVERLAASVSSPLDEAVRIGAALPDAVASEAARAVWRTLDATGDRRLRLARARVLASAGEDISTELESLLKPRRDSRAEIAFAADVLEVVIHSERWRIVEGALGHRFAEARRKAMGALGQRSAGALPPVVLALASDESHRVRSALLELLKGRAQAEHADALVRLADDTWTTDIHAEGRRIRCPIAEGAADILKNPPALGELHCEAILSIALKVNTERVSRALFAVLIVNGTATSRAAVLTAALEANSLLAQRLAAEALALNEKPIDAALTARVTQEHLVKGPPRSVFALAYLVGLGAHPDQVIAVAKAIVAIPDRQLLLVPLYIGVASRNAEAAQNVRSWLPSPFATALDGFAHGGAQLPRDALEQLKGSTLVGEILADETFKWFGPVFAEANTKGGV